MEQLNTLRKLKHQNKQCVCLARPRRAFHIILPIECEMKARPEKLGDSKSGLAEISGYPSILGRKNWDIWRKSICGNRLCAVPRVSVRRSSRKKSQRGSRARGRN